MIPRALSLCYDVRVFSSRLNWDLRRNPLSALLEEKRRAGTRILDLTESNPTRVGLVYPQAEILAALADAKVIVATRTHHDREWATAAIRRKAGA